MRSVRYYALSALLVCGTLLPIPFLNQHVYAWASEDWVDAEQLYSHVEHLAKIARPPATETEFAAAVYVENALRSYGYETKLHPFAYYTYRKPASLSLTIADWPEQKWAVSGFTFGENGTATAEIVDAGYGRPADYANDTARGKIALVKRGELPFGEKVRQAAAAGAVAIIIWNDRDEAWNASLGEPLDMAVPVIGLSQADGRKLQKRIMDKQSVAGELKISGALTLKQTSYNIIASKKPTHNNTGQVVMVAAHHDSAGLSGGANHNASGVAAMLEVARQMANKSIDTEVSFVSFGAVTTGNRGPIAYANSLTAKEKQSIAAAYYIDGVGGQKGELLAWSGTGSENLPVQLLREAGASLPESRWMPEKENAHRALTTAGIAAALVTRALPNDGTGKPTDDSIAFISPEQLSQATQVVLSAVSKMTDAATPVYPTLPPVTAQPESNREALK